MIYIATMIGLVFGCFIYQILKRVIYGYKPDWREAVEISFWQIFAILVLWFNVWLYHGKL